MKIKYFVFVMAIFGTIQLGEVKAGQIDLTRTKPTPQEKLNLPYEYKFNASQDVEFVCNYDGQATIEWSRCADRTCFDIERSLPQANGKTLSFPAFSTTYKTPGTYKCTAESAGSGLSMEQTINLQLTRFAPPKLMPLNDIELKVNTTLEVMCVEKYAEPKSVITWTFRPENSSPPSGKLPAQVTAEDIDSAETRGSLLTFAKGKARPELNGVYTCTAENKYGKTYVFFTIGKKDTLRCYECDDCPVPFAAINVVIERGCGSCLKVTKKDNKVALKCLPNTNCEKDKDYVDKLFGDKYSTFRCCTGSDFCNSAKFVKPGLMNVFIFTVVIMFGKLFQ